MRLWRYLIGQTPPPRKWAAGGTFNPVLKDRGLALTCRMAVPEVSEPPTVRDVLAPRGDRASSSGG